MSLSLPSQSNPAPGQTPVDPKTAARRLLSEAITGYLALCKDLTAATEHATQTTGSLDTGACRRAYQRLTELGDQLRLAQRRLETVARQARRAMTAAEIEEFASKLDKRDTTDSAPVLIKSVFATFPAAR